MSSDTEKSNALTGHNSAFLSNLYARYKDNPDGIEETWRAFFADMKDDAEGILGDAEGPSWTPPKEYVYKDGDLFTSLGYLPDVPKGKPGAAPGKGADPKQVRAATLDSIRALMLIRSYRVRGHLEADLDPLGLTKREEHPELDPKSYGFTEADYDREIFIDNVLGFETATLRQIVKRCRETYCGHIGVEFMHIQEPDQKAWVQERIEDAHNQTDFTEKGRIAILDSIIRAEGFEGFLDKKYTGTKRFGLDGGESLIPGLEQIIKRGGQLGVNEIVLGMAHRGRLNVLANMMGKPYQAIFSEFEGGTANPEDVGGSGDVKYHLGTSSDREFDGNMVHLSLTANPSHLEAADPVVLGKVRAKQYQRGPGGDDQVMGLLLHGDAAFAGQGLVPETLDLSELKGYRTGGTIHFIINNQIGFTTKPSASRSGPYCSEVAKIVQAPVFHVNGDDPEAVVHVSRIAMEFRQKFKKDVVIDMWCYRRYGHNEGDEPKFTQPLMYEAIGSHPPVSEVYTDKLEKAGLFSSDRLSKRVEAFQEELQADFDAAKSYKPNKADWLEGSWSGLEASRGEYIRGDTPVEIEKLKEVGRGILSVPDGFNLNSKIARQFKTKLKNLEAGENIDWALGEALAFGTLVAEGTPVRMSGQDVGRGTFSQRHAVLTDQETEEAYIPLNDLTEDQARFEIINSPLSEFGVLGFEYGYSLAEPNMLVIWEAQFGDFANGAQVIIDQFIASGESKWLRMSGLVMMLPHGYEGQGPEHSSARLERYLQLCAEDNMQVVNCTTPASFFHVLRRQMRRKFRKPLIAMTPKSLLRHKLAVSTLEEMGPGTTFHRVLYDNERIAKPKDIRRVVLCSGKVYYDLFEARAERKIKDVDFLRLEQIAPFPDEALHEELAAFAHAEVVWCQEEPQNAGSWDYVDRKLEQVLVDLKFKNTRPRYVGRPAAASPATGSAKRHAAEQKALVDEALTID